MSTSTNRFTTTPQTTPFPLNSIIETPALIPGEQITSIQIDPTILQIVSITSNGNDQGVVITAFAYMLPTRVSVQKILDPQILETAISDSTKVKVSDILKFQPSGTVFRSPVTIFLATTRPAKEGKRFAIFKLDEYTKTWREQQKSVTDTTRRIVSIQTMSFSFWTVFEVASNTEQKLAVVDEEIDEKKEFSNLQIALISTLSVYFGCTCCVFLLIRYVGRGAMQSTQDATESTSVTSEQPCFAT